MQTRPASPQEFHRIAAYYQESQYGQALDPQDSYVIAEEAGAIYGAVRLCEEHGVLVLRGMSVSPENRRQGIGTRMLKVLEFLIGNRECYCIPYSHLRSFYAQVAFHEIDPREAPVFLQERLAIYQNRLRLDVILMRRPICHILAPGLIGK